jgi:hypothetical protein
MNALLRRRPLQIAGLALRTCMGYWGIASIQSYAREDLGGVDLTDDQIKMLAQRFRFATVKWITSQPRSLLQWYFVRAWPYYFIVVVSPLVCAFVTWLGRDRAFAFLLFIHASILMVVLTALSPQAWTLQEVAAAFPVVTEQAEPRPTTSNWKALAPTEPEPEPEQAEPESLHEWDGDVSRLGRVVRDANSGSLIDLPLDGNGG